MFGDTYTNNLLSGSPRTTMIGNLIGKAADRDRTRDSLVVLMLSGVAHRPDALLPAKHRPNGGGPMAARETIVREIVVGRVHLDRGVRRR